MAKSTLSMTCLLTASLVATGFAVGTTANAYLDHFELGLPPEWQTAGNAFVSPFVPAHSGANVLVIAPSGGWHDEALRTYPGGASGRVSAWVFDEMGGCLDGSVQTTGIFNADNRLTYPFSVRGLGINSDVSPCTYVYRVENTFTPTLIPRTPGWHEMSITWDYTTGTLTASIDGVPVYTDVYLFSIDSAWIANNYNYNPGLTYWDDVTYASVDP